MKWYDKIGIIKLSLLLFSICMFISFELSRMESDWWPEAFLILAEAALSIVIVLKIIEVSSRRERKQRWESVKLVAYSQILDKLRLIGYHVCRTTFMVYLESQDIDRERIEKQGIDDSEAVLVLNSLARNIKENYRYLYDVININSDSQNTSDPMDQQVTDLIECFDNINHEIFEYKIALVPRVLALSDDVIVNKALLEFENESSIIFYRIDFLKRYASFNHDRINRLKYIVLGRNSVDPAFITLASLLKTTSDLYELLQQKSASPPEKNLKEEIIEKLKYWWLPPQFWRNNSQ